jgi:hypothetical protein
MQYNSACAEFEPHHFDGAQRRNANRLRLRHGVGFELDVRHT